MNDFSPYGEDYERQEMTAPSMRCRTELDVCGAPGLGHPETKDGRSERGEGERQDESF